mgnify:CR=1 FL=1
MSMMTVQGADAQLNTLKVDFYLDLICPWCWIGLRNLRSAWQVMQQEQPGLKLQVQWHADTLLPQIPPQGIDYQSFYVARLGSPAAVDARRAQVRAAAQAVGLTLNFEAIALFPNSRLACALVNLAQDELAGDAMFDFVQTVFTAYFQQGRDIGDVQVLMDLAQGAGLSVEVAQLNNPAAARSLGHAGGVPHYVFNQRETETGAVPAEHLLRLMRAAAAQQTDMAFHD